jgi:hypothetical protein
MSPESGFARLSFFTSLRPAPGTISDSTVNSSPANSQTATGSSE